MDVGASRALNVNGVPVRAEILLIVGVLSKESSAKALVSHEFAGIYLLTSLTCINIRIYRL